MPEKVVLAYSGGLDTSIIIPWLKENYSYDVIAMVGDVGQGDDIEAVVEKAYATGASKVVVEDLREEFLTGYVFPALKAGAVWAPDDRRRAAQSDAVRDAQRAGRYASPPAFPVPDAATLALIQERGWTLEEFNARKATAVRRISLRQV